MKNFLKQIVSLSMLALAFNVAPALAASSTSSSYQILDAEIRQGGNSGTSASWSLIGSVGENAIGRSTSATRVVTAGSLTAPRCTSPTLTATSGSSQVILNWTAATCQGGWTLTGYEVCVGTATNTYSTCTNVGTVLTSTQTATPGVATFFRIRVVATGAASSGTPAGNFGSRSSEVMSVAGGGSTGGGGGGGGGGGPAPVTSLTLTAPSGGEQLVSGSSFNIRWSGTGTGVSTIRLRLSGDGGLNFNTTIIANQSNTGTYAWTVPTLIGSQFRVTVEGLDAQSNVVVSDMSKNNFSIGPAGNVPPPVVAPTPPSSQPTAPTPRLSAPSVVSKVDVVLGGQTSPSAGVAVWRDGAVAGSVNADFKGNWSILLPGLTPGGIYTFVFQATDKDGVKSSTTTRSITLPLNAPVYQIGDLLLPPTGSASKSSVHPGADMRFFGEASPDTSLFAEFDDMTRTLAIAADGLWNLTRNTKGISGSHTLRARVARGTNVSSWSTPISFDVSGTPVARPAVKSADLSGDGHVGLHDFSILLSFWHKQNPPAADDLNGDGTVDLHDLSILLYAWTG